MFKTLLQKNRIALQKSTASAFLLEKAERYLQPLQQQLLEELDKRLVNTFYNVFMSILLFRNSKMALRELGGFICGHAHAPAGTKRVSNLLRCPKWEASWIDEFFFEKTKSRINQLSQVGKGALFLWDDSRIEKPESWFLEGLCSVEIGPPKR